MKKILLVFIVMGLQLSLYANNYFEFQYNKVGSIQIFRNGKKMNLTKIHDIEEPALGQEVDLDNDGIPEVEIIFKELGGQNGPLSLFLKYDSTTNQIKTIVSNTDLHNVKYCDGYIISSYSDVGFWYEVVSKYDIKSNKIISEYKDKDGSTDLGLLRYKNNYTQIVDKNKNILDRQILSLNLKLKSSLYKSPSESSITKMYLLAGDKVNLLDTKTDENGQEWYYISYQGKKEVKAWIKAEAVK